MCRDFIHRCTTKRQFDQDLIKFCKNSQYYEFSNTASFNVQIPKPKYDMAHLVLECPIQYEQVQEGRGEAILWFCM